MMSKSFFTLGMIYLTVMVAQAQILVSRNFEANPLTEETDKKKRLFGNTFFGAEVGHGFFSTEEEQTWNIKYHGFIEFYRWGNRASLGLSLAHELHANPHNEIYFNPRGAIWNESLVYHHKLEKITIHFGANHRCRHNIDNADPPRPDIPRSGYIPQSRVLVLTSLYTGFQSDPVEINSNWQFNFFGRADAYLYKEDARRPRDNQEGSWEDIQASVLGGFSVNHQLNDQWQIYSRNNLNYIFFEDYPNQVNYRLEAGISVLGEKAHTSLFVAYQYFFDDTSRSFPVPSSVLFVGLRGISLNFY